MLQLLSPSPRPDPHVPSFPRKRESRAAGRRAGNHRGLAVLLAGGLSLVAAGCAVLPIALQRPLPSTGMALRSMETAQERLAEMQDSAANQFEAASVTQPRAVHGAPQAAYQRWVDDEVRELPSPASTVAIMGGTQ